MQLFRMSRGGVIIPVYKGHQALARVVEHTGVSNASHEANLLEMA